MVKMTEHESLSQPFMLKEEKKR